MSFTRSDYAPVLFIRNGAGDWDLVPQNSQAKDALDAAFTADGALTTVAITQADAGRGGYGETTGPYSKINLALS
jgi:hypothetical protein